MQVHNVCLVCQSSDLRELKKYRRVPLLRCGHCGLVFCKLIPSAKELEVYYSQYGLDQYLSPITVKRYHEWLDTMEPYRKTGNLLDVGCGNGLFLGEAIKRGWKVFGTEYSDAQVAICRSKGINMHQGPLSTNQFSDETFDVIVSIEVIEHINNPDEEMHLISTLLRKGGLFYCTTPNFNALSRLLLGEQYNIISYPEHLAYYTPRSLSFLMKKHGLLPLRVETNGISITRFNQSIGKREQRVVSATSDDERLRGKIESCWYLRLAKSLLNATLNLTGLGYSLKANFYRR